VNAGALPFLCRLLRHIRSTVVKEAAWTVSNITAGNTNQIEAVVQADILPVLVHVLANGDAKSQKEAAWAVTNLTSGGTPQQLAALINAGAIPAMCNLLTCKDAKTVEVILDGITSLLAVSICLVGEFHTNNCHA